MDLEVIDDRANIRRASVELGKGETVRRGTDRFTSHARYVTFHLASSAQRGGDLAVLAFNESAAIEFRCGALLSGGH